MSDFMKWLYGSYIRPQLEKAPPGEYELHLSIMENDLEPYLAESRARELEFTAIHAFLLGLRTGRGLPGE